jgi:hypothetical protein
MPQSGFAMRVWWRERKGGKGIALSVDGGNVFPIIWKLFWHSFSILHLTAQELRKEEWKTMFCTSIYRDKPWSHFERGGSIK